MFEKIDVWYISCSTGCTCCSSENHEFGFFKSEESAEKQKEAWLQGKNNPLGSQYAKYGRYTVYKTEADLLPDDRMIVEDKVYPQDQHGQLCE